MRNSDILESVLPIGVFQREAILYSKRLLLAAVENEAARQVTNFFSHAAD